MCKLITLSNRNTLERHLRKIGFGSFRFHPCLKFLCGSWSDCFPYFCKLFKIAFFFHYKNYFRLRMDECWMLKKVKENTTQQQKSKPFHNQLTICCLIPNKVARKLCRNFSEEKESKQKMLDHEEGKKLREKQNNSKITSF